MKLSSIINVLETVAPPSFQESYDNSGWITGDPSTPCTGVLISLDATEAVVEEAVQKGCNLLVVHHPIIFSGLKRIDPGHYVGRAVIAAIKKDVAIYAIHTNLDNVLEGVNGKIASLLGLTGLRVLRPLSGVLRQLITYVPKDSLETLRNALFQAGAGHIGQYDQCGFYLPGTGSFRPLEGAHPYVGQVGERHYEEEVRIELVYFRYREAAILQALKQAHPYEEVAFQLTDLPNAVRTIGSGAIGKLPEPMMLADILLKIKEIFRLDVIRHTPLTDKKITTIAVCGGAGSFLTRDAIRAGADLFLTSDVKYHEFFEADGRLVLADIGHFESEQFTIDLLFELIKEKFPNFAVHKSVVQTNPVQYFI
jgi:dinuclear metal center YbgI/SA1388 family protein